MMARLSSFIRKHYHLIIVASIVVLAAALRFWRIWELPPGLHPDEAANGLDIFRIFAGDHRPLYSTNGPRESLFFYLQAIFVALFGNTAMALRLAPAFIGTAAVFTTYLWAKSWFGRRVGVVSAFLMAVTPWAIFMSRLGFRASMVPLFVTLSLWLLTRAFQTGRLKWFVFSGISLGLGLYTYIAFRLFIPGLLVVGLFMLWRYRAFAQRWMKPLGVSVLTMAIVLLPMFLFGLKHPADVFVSRSSTSFMNPELNNGRPIQTLLDTTVKTALMFNIKGDENYRHNLGGQPQLNAFVGIMFILGVLVTITRMHRATYFALLVLLGSLLLPEVLTAEGIPHALRAVGALPIAIVLAVVGINYLLERWNKTFPINSAARSLGASGVALLLMLSGLHGYQSYFVAWAGDPATYKAFSEDMSQLASYANRNQSNHQRYLVIGGYSNIAVEYLTHNKTTYTRLEPAQIAGYNFSNGPKQFLISTDFKQKALEVLAQKFPGGKTSSRYSEVTDEEMFVIYEVK